MMRAVWVTPERRTARLRLRECQSCGLLQRVPALSPGTSAHCSRCGATLHRASLHPLEHSLALTLTALVMLGLVSTTMLMSVETAGITLQADLFSGPEELVQRGMAALAVVVVFVTLVGPFGQARRDALRAAMPVHGTSAAPSAPGIRLGRAADTVVNDRGVRIRRPRRLCETRRPSDDQAWHWRARTVRPDFRTDVDR
jgi:hypothetical protein